MPLRLNRNIVIMPSIEMKRTFHPVGQGAFYTEVFDCPNGDQKVVVYDCGTETGVDSFAKWKGIELKDQIVDFANSLKPGNNHIDYLFISHFHDDHISGLPDLINLLTPSCVVIPMLPMHMILTTRISNLIFFRDRAKLSDQFIKDLFLGPDPQRDDGYRFDRVVAVGTSARNGENDPLYPQNAQILNDDESISLLDKDNNAFWRYRPFNSVDLEDKRAKRFIDEIRKIPGILNNDDSLNVQEVLKKKNITKLKKLYKKVMKGASDNLYTLVVESEPLRETNTQGDNSLPGCVYFGDFVPSKKVWPRFRKKIDDYEGIVGIIQVPHHGSKYNWRSEMLDGGNKKHCVVSAGMYNKYHHPYYWIINEIQRSGQIAHVVSEYPTTEFSLIYLISR